ncbi:hypothetical protein PENTCL1PPCAC_16161, partial [Pristionchus entomophagus]
LLMFGMNGGRNGNGRDEDDDYDGTTTTTTTTPRTTTTTQPFTTAAPTCPPDLLSEAQSFVAVGEYAQK